MLILPLTVFEIPESQRPFVITRNFGCVRTLVPLVTTVLRSDNNGNERKRGFSDRFYLCLRISRQLRLGMAQAMHGRENLGVIGIRAFSDSFCHYHADSRCHHLYHKTCRRCNRRFGSLVYGTFAISTPQGSTQL